MQQPKEQSIRKKLGSILGLGASRTTPIPQKNFEDLYKLEHSTFFTDDVLRELDSSLPTQRRVRAMKEHLELVATRRLEEHAVESIWTTVKDLIEPSQPMDIRHSALTFVRNLIYGQFEDLGVLRAHFLNVIQQHNVKEDAQLRLNILRVLTQDGKNIHHLEESIGPFLFSWMPEIVSLGHSTEYLSLLINFVHYNAAYLDGEVLVGVVRLTSSLARRSSDIKVLTLCLDFINAVVCYSSLPVESLHDLVITLCHTLNLEKFAKRSLEVMLKLLGTHLGRSAIYTMCTILQEKSLEQNAFLLRGSVFYISMSMWGIRRVENLDLTFKSVLPSIKQAVLSNHTIVVFEVALSLRRLVRTYFHKLLPLEWDIIYNIMTAIQNHLKLLSQKKGENVVPPTNNLGQCLRDLIVAIEEFYGNRMNIGDPEKFFNLVEDNMDIMPLKSVLNLVSYKTSMIDSSDFKFVEKVVKFMENFYMLEKRPAVRIAALDYIAKIIMDKPMYYERDLMELVVLRFLQDVDKDPDSEVRCRAAQLLVQLLTQSSAEWGTQLLALINSILQRGLQIASKAREEKSMEEPILHDSKEAVYGLTETFKDKLQSSSPVAAQILSLLVVLLQQHYDEGYFFPTACSLRVKIFGTILNLHSNEYGQVGCMSDDGSIKFSPFFVCRQPSGCDDHTPVITPMLLDYRTTFSAVLACLEKECEWEVLSQVLHQLNILLQDRLLTLSSLPDLSSLCQLLCHLVDGKSPRIQKLRNVSSGWSKDLSSMVFLVLTTLTTYPSHLDRTAQHALVCCLETGLIGKSAQTCVLSLSLCSLELQATMTHLLPHVLQRMGQVAATPTLALPVLEFLSGLIPIPSLYNGFVDLEYLSIFAIALPYADHKKYPLYVVAMAHRVIAQWFVRCRMHYRPIVASFICKKLSTNLEDIGSNWPTGLQSSPMPRVVVEEGGVGLELVQVCMDMMARYTYSNLSSLPSRSSGSNFLISGGPSKTWIIGNSLVTITTSRTGGGSVNGVCKRCVLNKKGDVPVGVSPLRTNGSNMVDQMSEFCDCWRSGWAEIKIRRPSGNTGWMMRLENRPHPLSLTHPSTYSVPESELGFLATNIPPERTRISGGDNLEKEINQDEMFFSCEVGSFTDISFMSSGMTENSTGTSQDQKTGYVTTRVEGISESGSIGRFIRSEVGSGGDVERDNITGSDVGTVREENDNKNEIFGAIGDTSIISMDDTQQHNEYKEEKDKASIPNLLSISEAAVVDGKHDEKQNDDSKSLLSLLSISEAATAVKDDEQNKSSVEGKFVEDVNSNKSLTLPIDVSVFQGNTSLFNKVPSVKHSTNSQSWSENGGTLPLTITPRASSYSFSMEHLPPLLSYDGGEEFSFSPLLHEGEEIMSEEEQLSLYASMSELQGDGRKSDSCSSTEAESTTDSDEEGENFANRSEDAKEKAKEDIPIPIPVTTIQTISTSHTPHLKHKSLSEEASAKTCTPSAQESIVPPTDSTSKLHPSPLSTRRKSVPSVTPPGNSPSISRKRLIFTPRPLSGGGGGGGVSESGARGEDDQFNNPSYIFLQLYNSRFLGDQSDVPILLPANETADRAIKVLDHIPPYETHKIGVVYVDRDQTSEIQILSNTFGSSRYLDFLRGLGPILSLPDIPPDMVYLGGLDCSGTDGEFSFCYHDDITQVIFHVATLMPTDLIADPSCSNKKLHIGNDFVTIVYNDSGSEYKFGTIKGQFNYVEVLVEPLQEGMNQVRIHAKKGMDMIQTSPVFISDSWLPILVRQKALHANLASMAHASSAGVGGALECNLSNWLGRLHQIAKMREKYHHEDDQGNSNSQGNRTTPRPSHCDNTTNLLLDFTTYS